MCFVQDQERVLGKVPVPLSLIMHSSVEAACQQHCPPCAHGPTADGVYAAAVKAKGLKLEEMLEEMLDTAKISTFKIML